MESRNDILNELREISPVVAAINKVNVFTVPEGYFDVLSDDILAGIRSEQKIEAGFNEGFAKVPAGYFDNLASNIMGRIKASEAGTAAEEIRALSPMLYSIQNENVFEVPAGYFESLSDAILNKVQPQQTKVVSMKRRTTSVIFKYAVAAAFTGVMALGVFKFTAQPTTDPELPQYVVDGLKVENVDQELSKISDDEIVKYLEASGTDVKTALVANSIDQNELPAQEDYLLDDQALDKYLKSINLEDSKN